MERLQKVLADAGIASRRKCEELIRQGRVRVNGRVIQEMGFCLDPEKDVVEFDGRKLPSKRRKVYYILYKPAGYLTTVRDQRGRRTVMELLAGVKERIYPVGRLDLDTEGLLLLTNDGQLANGLMHPRSGVDKVYQVTVKGIPCEDDLKKLREGILLEDGWTSPAGAEIKSRTGEDSAVLLITLHEGRKRQIKRMCAAIGHPVIHLKRVALGFLTLDGLEKGQYRSLSPGEVEQLKSMVGMYGT